MTSQEDADRQNREIIEGLHRQFEPLTRSLDPEVEPALTFTLPPPTGAESQ